jgi:glycosyltransferase involved in cell wall biosynthesis
MNKFTISALMPIRNGSAYLPSSISYLDANSEFLSEIVVIDDGSSDDTSKILLTWARQNSKVRLLATRGLGLVPALNLGLQNIDSDFVARFDVDDQYSHNRIRLQRELLSSETAVVFTDYEFFSGARRNLGSIPSPVFAPQTSVSLIRQQRTAHPSAIISRDALEEVGGYRLDDFPAEDYSLWLRLAKVGKLVSVPKPLLKYRLSSSSVSANHLQSMQLKRKELLKSIGLNGADVLASLNYLEEFGSSYAEFPDGSIRQFLHVIELKAACELLGLGIPNMTFIGEQIRLFRSLSISCEMGMFGLKTLQRKAFKKL